MVTGGAGFIGSHLVDQLVAYGAQVTVLDNLSTGNKANLAQSIKQITLIEDDIRNPQACLAAAQDCDYIFHMAACVSVPQSLQEPAFCHDVNVTGTANLLQAAYIHKVQRFVLSSSCAVYGQQATPCSEATPCSPTSPYAYSKLMGELLCQQYARVFKVPTLCLRYFNVIGTRQNPYGPYAGVYAKFSDLMQQQLPVTIFGDGNQTRDFVAVQEVVQANLRLALLPTEQCDGKAINIGTGNPTTVLQIFETLKTNYPLYKVQPVFAPARPGDIVYSCADTSLYRKIITQ